jgi:hypothetical protein
MSSKISELAPLATLTGAEYVPVAINGENKGFFVSKIKEYITKVDIGLDRVNNTNDLEKPISTATGIALAGKASSTHSHGLSDVSGLISSLNGKADTVHRHVATDISDFDQRVTNLITEQSTVVVSRIDW